MDRSNLRSKFDRPVQLFVTLLIALCLSLSVLFRVANLDQKVFWVDEVATVIRAAGYTKSEVTAQLAEGRPLAPAALLSYQQLAPDRTLADTIHALARSPEHAPLYFLLIRFWMQIFGSSVVAVRSFSVLSSVLVLPSVYWFCRTFGSTRTGWIAVSLLALSPFFVAYAQEARPYSFWLLTVVLCYGALLRAIRLQTVSSWGIYGLALTVSLYTSLLSLLLAVGQGIYVWKATGRTSLRRWLAAAGVAILAFLPWVWVVGQQWEALGSNTTWMRTALNPLVMLAIWLYSFAVLFFDVPVVSSGWVALAQAAIAFSVLAVMVYSLYYLQKMPRQIGLLIAALCLPIPISLIGLDLIFQGQASATTRYLMPSQFGVLIATASFLAMPSRLSSTRFRQIQQTIFVFLMVLSLISCLVNLNRSPDYQKDRNRANPTIAAILNQSTDPVLLAEPNQTLDLLSLSHSLAASVQIQIWPVERLTTEITIEPCQTRFLFNPSDALLTALQQMPDLTIQERYQPALLTPTDLHLSLWTVQAQSTQCE